MRSIFGILAFALILCFSAPDASAWVKRTTSGGGWFGYANTSDYTDDDGNQTIHCSGVGWDSCPVATASAKEQMLMDHAIGEITAGVLSGEFIDHPNQLKVIWTSDNAEMSNSDISIDPL